MSLLDDLTPAERAAAEQMVARARADLGVDVRLLDPAEVAGAPLALDALDGDPADPDPDPDADADADEAVRERGRARRARRAASHDAKAGESWDAFWSETERAEADEHPTTIIRGVTAVIPHDLPLKFERRAEQLKGSGREEDVRELVGMVFGGNVLDAWVDAGMGVDEFQTVLLWGMACGRGQAMTFAAAREAVRTQGKSLAPNREARRASERSGGPSKPTSGVSTDSTLPPSQR